MWERNIVMWLVCIVMSSAVSGGSCVGVQEYDGSFTVGGSGALLPLPASLHPTRSFLLPGHHSCHVLVALLGVLFGWQQCPGIVLLKKLYGNLSSYFLSQWEAIILWSLITCVIYIHLFIYFLFIFFFMFICITDCHVEVCYLGRPWWGGGRWESAGMVWCSTSLLLCILLLYRFEKCDKVYGYYHLEVV